MGQFDHFSVILVFFFYFKSEFLKNRFFQKKMELIGCFSAILLYFQSFFMKNSCLFEGHFGLFSKGNFTLFLFHHFQPSFFPYSALH